jgi:hypothetical protein
MTCTNVGLGLYFCCSLRQVKKCQLRGRTTEKGSGHDARYLVESLLGGSGETVEGEGGQEERVAPHDAPRGHVIRDSPSLAVVQHQRR